MISADPVTHRLELDVEGAQRLRRDALVLPDQPEQQVLGADIAVMEEPGLLLCQHDDAPGAIGEPLEHARSPSLAAVRTPAAESAARPGGTGQSAPLLFRIGR